jgi:hypothetical protein
MKLEVKRYNSQDDYTQGLLFIDGIFECYTIEDEQRTIKVFSETAISNGTYEVKLRTEGKFHVNYSKKFPLFHKGMLHVTNVPGFEYILIHIGNTDDDTAGCLLVGRGAGHDSIVESTIAYEAMYKRVLAGFERGEKVTITYSNL